MAGPGSQAARRDALAALFARATEPEQRFLVAPADRRAAPGRAGGRHGRGRRAGGRGAARRGPPGAACSAATSARPRPRPCAGGAEALRAVGLEVGRPVQPMLAAPGDDVDGGARRRPGRRPSSTSSTARACRSTAAATTCASSRAASTTSPRACPRSSRPCSRCPRATAVLDGEAIALTPDGRPHPFQVTASRFGTRRADADGAADAALLRRAAPRRRGPARPPGRRARRGPRRAGPGARAGCRGR